MKLHKLLYLFLLTPFCVKGQTVVQQAPVSSNPAAGNYNHQVFQWANGHFNLNLSIPSGAVLTLNNTPDRNGLLFLLTPDSTVYYRYNHRWLPMGMGGGADSLYVNNTFVGMGTISDPLGVNPDSVAMADRTVKQPISTYVRFQKADSTFTGTPTVNTQTHNGTINYDLPGAAAGMSANQTIYLTGGDTTYRFKAALGQDSVFGVPVMYYGGLRSNVTPSAPTDVVRLVDLSGIGTNIYNSDGSLTGTRKLSNAGHSLSADSLYLGGVQPTVAIGGNMVFAGDSFVNPAPGANPSSLAFSTQTAALFGSTEVNIGMSGTDLGAGGGTAWVNNLSRIPTKGGSDKYLLFCLGQNDINTATSSYFEHQFAADWITVLNNANSKGWAYNQIILTNVAFNPSTIPPGSLTLPQYLSRQAQFSHAVDSIASVLGCIDINLYGLVKYDGSNSLLSDGQHLNNVGNTLLARLIFNKVYPNVTQKGQPLAVAGLTDLTTLRLPKLPNIPLGATVNPMLIGITAGDTVGRIAQLPKDIGTAGNFYLNGTLYQPGWTTPPGYTVQSNDFSLSEGARITGIYTPNTGFGIYNYVQPMDISGGMTFFMNGGAGAAMTFMNNSHRNMALDAAGNIVSDGSVKITGLSNKFYFDDGSGYQSGIVPLTSASEQQIFNQKSKGSTSIYEANGTDGAMVKMFGINYDGQTLLQNDADFVTPDTYATVPSGKLTINSTTKGFIPPRMTTAQVVAMEKISSINVVNQGSGYTTASISLSGSTGSGFTATPVIVGGQIRSWTVTNGGTGYLTPQTATVTGDGTGSTALVQNYLIQGTLVFNTDSAKYQYYDGTVLRVIGNSGSGGGGTVTSVTGTTNRITSTGGATPAIDISASYVGQSSITTVGTLSTGSIPYSLLTGTPTVPTGANPSATAGTTAVNGSAPTFMRSDGAPKVDSTVFQTVLNFFPKGDTRYVKSSTISGLANPTATIGLTAVNGSATTGMRSDAAPALDQTITPVMTGLWTHSKSSLGTTQALTNQMLLVKNPTAAVLNGQQYSPYFGGEAQGWSTTSSVSMPVDMFFQVQSVQSGTAPTGIMPILASINGATPFLTGIQFTSTGGLLAGSLSSGSLVISSAGGNIYNPSNGGAGTTSNAAYLFAGASNVMLRTGVYGSGNTVLATGNSYGGFVVGSSPITTFTSGTHALIAAAVIKPAVITSGGATVTDQTSWISYNGTGGTNNWNGWAKGGTTRLTKLQVDSTASVTGNLTLVAAGNKLVITEGTNGSVGQTTLVAGTKAISISGVTTSTRAIVTLVSQGGTVTTTAAYAAVCTSGTLTITALTNAGTTDTTDTSTLNFWIVN